MKLIKSLFVLFVAASLVSCSNDDDNNVYLFNNANLAGIYNVTFNESTEVQSTNVNGVDIITTTTWIGDTFQLDVVFEENGSYSFNGLYRVNYKRVVNGEITDEYVEIIEVNNEGGDYTTNGETLELVLDDETHKVIHFNENEIRFTFEETWIENEDTFVLNEEIRLVRQ